MSTAGALPRGAARAMAAGLVAAALAGCGGTDEPKLAAADTAATVNGEAIPRAQLTEAGVRPAARDDAQALDRLVDSTLAVQAAKAQSLEKDAEVRRRLNAAARQALAAAYLERVADKVPEPSASQVKKYFEDNPPLFAKRRVYSFRELRLEFAPGELAKVRKSIESARGPAEVDRLLGSKRAAAQERQVNEPAERVPLLALKQLAELAPGRTLVLVEAPQSADGPERVRLITMSSAKAAPLTLEQAQPSITAFLRAKQRNEAVTAHMAELRAKAKIERFPPEERAQATADRQPPSR